MIKDKGLLAIDLHTHTFFSGDSSTSFEEYIKYYKRSKLDLVAVTDHGTINGALILKNDYGLNIIVGQEQRSTQGDIIGLFLNKKLPAGLNPVALCESIKEQDGLTLIPHPCDNSRSSIKINQLKELLERNLVDIIEIQNAKVRTIPELIKNLAKEYEVGICACSDAHVGQALGACKTLVAPFKGQLQLKEALLNAQIQGNFFDPPRPWKNQVLPSTSTITRSNISYLQS